ncbi:MAG: ABC transporter ATP-binding protein [Lachnospiraceae bacterium]|nr:ABC transporter ATP-binding protein [Lachnospiraceae bacterium]
MKEKFSDLKKSYLFIRPYDAGILKWLVFQGLVGAIGTYFAGVSVGLIIDSIIDKTFYDGMLMVLLIAGINALIAVANILLGRYIGCRRFLMELNYRKNKTGAYFRVPYSYMETAEFQDLRQNIRFSDDNMGSFRGLIANFERLISGVLNFLTGCAVLIGMLLYSHVQNKKAIPIMIGITGCIWLLSFLFTRGVKKVQELSNRLTPALFEKMTQGNRLSMYLADRIVHTYPMGKDVRVYRADIRINREYLEETRRMSETYRKLGIIATLPDTINNISGDIIKNLIYLALAFMAILKYITVGSVVMWANSIAKMLGTYAGIIVCMGEFSILQKRLSYSRRLLEIADAQNKETGEESDQIQSPEEIVFQNVGYRYPNSSEWALKDVNFTIRKGDRISIVGKNGAGKSTVVKLLCGLYEPTEGKILFDGRAKEEIPALIYRKMMAAVFQDFRVLSFTIEDNILMGKPCDGKKLEDAIRKCRLNKWIDTLEAGKNTFLFNDYEGGVECSGGEAQRVALARCLYADAPVMVFDEPTAALDARIEMEVFENMREISEDRTAIFVSHRLSSCLFSDRIFVFQDGRLVREGTHKELLKDEGCVYRELWDAQAQYYVS